MTPHQIDLVQSSWQRVAPIQDTAASLFYARLFELDADLVRLFKGSMVEQGRRLMTMIDIAVAGLPRVDQIAHVLRNLGARHAAYGVRDEHYDTVEAALLWTLEQGLAAAFTGEVAAAWTAAYCALASLMKEGAARVQCAA